MKRILLLAFLISSALASLAQAAVTGKDAAAIADFTATQCNDGTTSLSYTTTTGADLLVVVVAQETLLDNPIDSVTFNSLALTKHTSIATPGIFVSIWYRIAPSIGTYNVVADANTSVPCIIAARSYSGAHQTTPFGAAVTSSGTATSCSVEITDTAVGEIIVFGVTDYNGGTITPGGAATELVEDQTVTPMYTTYNEASGAGSPVTVSASWASSVYFGCAAASVQAAPSAADNFFRRRVQ